MSVFFVKGTDKLCPVTVAKYFSAVVTETSNEAAQGSIKAIKGYRDFKTGRTCKVT
jgi:hypothetical protein